MAVAFATSFPSDKDLGLREKEKGRRWVRRRWIRRRGRKT